MNAYTFLDNLTSLIRPLAIETNLAYWDLNTVYSPETEIRYTNSKKKLLNIYSDSALFQDLLKFLHSGDEDPVNLRQINLLYHVFLMNQLPANLLEEIILLENTIESDFVNFRSEIDAENASDNDLKELLANTADNMQAREAWEAGKQIGKLVAPKIIRLVELRNKSARFLGFNNFFDLALFANELDPGKLMNLLNQLAGLTREPFARLKKNLDQELAAKFGLTIPELKPWNYGDPFFQEVPKSRQVDLDPLFQIDLIEAATRFYREIGLDPLPILQRSDLYERSGKSQHAFCTDIDQTGDVRILCNLRPNEYWMNTLLHELGHGVYDLYRSPGLPYFLQTPAHILTTEAVAMMMGRLTRNPSWLQEYLHLPSSELQMIQPFLWKELVKGELIFIRWGLVMVNFEYRLYQDPHQDLNNLWWDLVESFQMLTRPPGRSQPDWAAKIHIGTAPVYYQNYLLGELAASQILEYLNNQVCRDHRFIQNPGTGKYLTEQIFAPGALYQWNQLLKQATGEYLNPRFFENEVNSAGF